MSFLDIFASHVMCTSYVLCNNLVSSFVFVPAWCPSPSQSESVRWGVSCPRSRESTRRTSIQSSMCPGEFGRFRRRSENERKLPMKSFLGKMASNGLPPTSDLASNLRCAKQSFYSGSHVHKLLVKEPIARGLSKVLFV